MRRFACLLALLCAACTPAPSPANAPPSASAVPPGVDAERARLASSICAAAYDPKSNAVGCRSHPPFAAAAQRPDGTLPAFTGDPLAFCAITEVVRGAFTGKDEDEALVVFAPCKENDPDATWDAGLPGSALLVELRDGRWQTKSYVPAVNLNACVKDRRKDGRDVLLCRSNLSTGVSGAVFYVFVVDLAHAGAHTIARVYSDDELCGPLLDVTKMESGYTRARVMSAGLANGSFVVKVLRAHVAPAPDLLISAKKACVVSPKLPAIVPADTESTLEFVDDGTAFVPTPATKALLDRWQSESPERFNGLIEAGPP